ncbi:hypothetical protein SODALDRAFT_335272 [Sodiomyces alkalinus F11]|uniref:Isochorismatase family protein family n=1 Tax=Sodiomyces alkalinus (strain CBS 110278 / VKM F-3762 / F11) TaxID=1314773 RepID=A0A3N2PNU7_SODAK|nr:hypothetical protein SODALDRAFT_335272 [Sodiomyces alkalinus F11]ROT36201.1 hypothetical protein SODALDRAFT_335272 [Sodiomyces alkalinus F11]
MFPFDQVALPSIPVRKALLVIDFQNDFLDPQGPLPVIEPRAFVDRTLELAKEFRRKDYVVWVCTEFKKKRVLGSEQIIISEEDSWKSGSCDRDLCSEDAVRPPSLRPNAPESDPEAFLSQSGTGTGCARSASGSQVPSNTRRSFGPRDISFVKSHYSAFKSGELLQLLRGKLVTQLFICGSLANIGVYATTIDAAMYGYDITIVEDCCGHRSHHRLTNAIESAVDLTGCKVLKADVVIERLQSKPLSGSGSVSGSIPSAATDTSHKQQSGLGTKSSAYPSRIMAPDSSRLDLHERLAALDISSSKIIREDEIGQPLEVDPDAQPLSPAAQEALKEGSREDAKGKISFSDTSCPEMKGVLEPTDRPERSDAPRSEKTLAAAGVRAATEASASSSLSTATTANEPRPSSPGESQDGGRGPICEGDTTIIHDVLPPPLADGIFEKLKEEIQWRRMSHQGGEVPRLVAVQGEVAADGSMPVYRHPADESPPLLPFSPTVLAIKAEIERHLGHPLNHALIQLYRDGKDYISEHSDKTLDIVKGSFIANVSFGAERTMVFRTKRLDKDQSSPSPSPSGDAKRRIQRVQLPHNSLCRMGLTTNMRWLHAIKQDKRAEREKSPAELAFSGERISLTFRRIGTFLDRDGTLIWGQGATGKTRDAGRVVVSGQSSEAVSMIRAFGAENHATSFDWEEHYGKGFDVLHITQSPRLFYSGDDVINMRVQLMLAKYGITFAKGRMPSSADLTDGDTPDAKEASPPLKRRPMRFEDNDAARSTIEGDVAIMLYVDAVYGCGKGDAIARSPPEIARVFTRFQQGIDLLDKWRTFGTTGCDERTQASRKMKQELAVWDGYASEGKFVAGSRASLADFAVWPVLHTIVQKLGLSVLDTDGTRALKAYYEAFLGHESVSNVLAGI